MNKGIQQFSVICLALVVFIRMMAMPISLIDYSLNNDFIARALCENRMNNSIHCGGKCYLHKQLARADENQNTPGQKAGLKIPGTDFFQPVKGLSFIHIFLTSSRISSVYNQRISDIAEGCLLRPPIV